MAKRAGYQVVGLPNYVVWVSAHNYRIMNIQSDSPYSILIPRRNRVMQHDYCLNFEKRNLRGKKKDL